MSEATKAGRRAPKWSKTADGIRAKWLSVSMDYRQLARLAKAIPLDERLRRLFAVACFRAVAPASAVSPVLIDSLDVAERFADGLATPEELSAAESAAESAAWNAVRSAAWSAAWSAAESAAESAAWNAARSAAWSAAWSAAESAAWSAQAELLVHLVGPGWRFDSRWRSTPAIALARHIYDEKVWDVCPILADALQDAGCEEATVLDYLRGDAPKFRGCRVLDELLGYSEGVR